MAKQKYIDSPETLWTLFKEYERDTKDNPKLVEDYVGGAGKKVVRKKERPVTLESFTRWLNDADILVDLADYLKNKDNRYSEFTQVCNRIRIACRADGIEGAMCGIYAPGVTARVHGLVEKTEQAVTHKEQPLLSDEPLQITD